MKPSPILFCCLGLVLWLAGCQPAAPTWTSAELDTLRTLWLGSLPPLPADPSNQYGDNPQAAALGEKLFFDTRFSQNGAVACGTCHLPDLAFQDGLPLAQGVGTTTRRTMPIVGTAYSPWFFWDGRKDSQWAQALGPLESPVEHGGNRTLYADLMATYYRAEYEAVFGPLPDLSGVTVVAGSTADPAVVAAWQALDPAGQEQITRVYVNMGKAIAAFERTLLPAETRFDQYVAALLEGEGPQATTLFSADEVAGLKLFIGSANCTQCHNGPLLTDNDFHNTGVPAGANLPDDPGRATGAPQVLADEFNCLSRYSDARPESCAELTFILAEGEELVRAFKPPSLRGVAGRPPYMHAGQLATLETVIAHYNLAPAAPAGHSQLQPLGLTPEQIQQLIAFLQTLSPLSN